MKSSEVISGQLKELTDRADEAVTAIFELLNRVRREKEQGLIPDEDLKKLLEQFADAANDIEIIRWFKYYPLMDHVMDKAVNRR